MPRRKDLAEELNFLSGLLSERVRFLAAGTLVFCWTFILEGIASSEGEAFLKPLYALPPMVLSLLGLVADFLQYWSGYRLNVVLLRKLEREGSDEISYDRSRFYYRLREIMFHTKILLVCASVLLLITVVSVRLLSLLTVS
jgi:hypothetical protein